MRGGPSRRARENYLVVKDSNIVGNNVVLSLQIWEIDTAADILKGSFFVVWKILRSKVATSSVAKEHPALIDYAVIFSIVLVAKNRTTSSSYTDRHLMSIATAPYGISQTAST